MSPAEVEHLLYKKSGLLGLSGVSNDMRDLLGNPDPHAQQAVDYFVYQAAKHIGALAAVLGGVDALVFTAGIGERSAEIRRRICAASAWLGIELDDAANDRHAARITAQGSRVSAWVIPTNEELMIARHTGDLLGLRHPATAGAAAGGKDHERDRKRRQPRPRAPHRRGRDSRARCGRRRSTSAPSSN